MKLEEGWSRLVRVYGPSGSGGKGSSDSISTPMALRVLYDREGIDRTLHFDFREDRSLPLWTRRNLHIVGNFQLDN